MIYCLYKYVRYEQHDIFKCMSHIFTHHLNILHYSKMTKIVAVTAVYSVPDDGSKGLPKHVELLTPNKEHKELHLVGIYMISIY